ncbi:MAG TPA: EF-P beta-lysylation protein EpmB [Steroidobacteraceae bacterium]|nr:EF-P beta-lysylation protein EpmB [Steroidobacteraceae bacterium]
MITTSPTPRQPEGPAAWQRELAHAISDPAELCALLQLDARSALQALAPAARFRLRVPRGFVRRMRRGDPRDPLLLQVLPGAPELLESPGYSADPLGERAVRRAPGLLHKYRGRALLISTGACAVHCRYCFRREYPYAEDADGAAALTAIAADSSIEEVILSGGDPLSLTTARLRRLTDGLRGIAHVRRLRLHTRTPVVLPERVDAALGAWLASLPWPCVVVLHCNHANEIDASVRAAAARLRAAGATLLNQSVLLAGVNDSPEALRALSEALWSAGVLPYYLHLLDPVRGTRHFEVSEPRARWLVAQLAARLPGYLVPRLARESGGAPGKTLIAPAPWAALADAPP